MTGVRLQRQYCVLLATSSRAAQAGAGEKGRVPAAGRTIDALSLRRRCRVRIPGRIGLACPVWQGANEDGREDLGKSAKAAKTTTAKRSVTKPPKPSKASPNAPAKSSAGKTAKPESGKVALLSGGNPQIAKGYGEAPVQAYIAAMPGWKRDVGRRLDALVERTVPGVKKAVKWNSPFYGVEEGVWFLSFHVFAKYVKVAFFRGAELGPVPPGASKQKNVRYLDIYEGQLDEAQLAKWVKQASKLPGEKM